MGCNEKIRAVNPLVDLFVCFVLHVKRIIGLHAVDNDLFRQLDGQSVLVNCNFLDVVSASDLNSCLSDQVLDYHVCHLLAVSVSLLVESMDALKFDVKGG